jgi:hypothetical protein
LYCYFGDEILTNCLGIEKVEERDKKELMVHFNSLLEKARKKKDIKTVDAILQASDASMECMVPTHNN